MKKGRRRPLSVHVTQLEDGTLETSEAEVKVQERSGDTQLPDDVVGASLYDVHYDCDTLDPHQIPRPVHSWVRSLVQNSGNLPHYIFWVNPLVRTRTS